MADQEIDETPETTVVPAEETKPSIDDRLGAIVDKFTSKAGAEETAADEKPGADGTTADKADADQDGAEGTEVEGAVTPPEKIVVAADQLADRAYWGKLDADGWKRMERDYPAETALVKEWQRTVTAQENRHRKELDELRTKPQEARHEALSSDEPSAELIAAVEMSQSLDPKEAAKGHELIADLTFDRVAKKRGIDPQQTKETAIATSAYEAAIAVLPDIAKLPTEELNAAVTSSRALTALARIGTPEALTEAMIGAGEIVIANRKQAAAKAASDKAAKDIEKKGTLRTVQSNARPASGDALKPHGASPNKLTIDERLNARFDKEVARQGS